jgi:translation initiation factor 4A
MAESSLQNGIVDSFEVDNELIMYDNFEDMDLPPDLLRGIYAYGFTKPSEIQKKGIKIIADGKELIAQANSGTGKTGTFTIGSLARLDPTLKAVQVLCLAPTRELAEQIQVVAEAISKPMGVNTYAAMGKTPVREDIRAIGKGVQFLVGTPGRIYDMMKRYVLKTDSVRCFVMDEADEMLSKGFKEQIYEIFQFIPKKCQVCIFSATMTEEALELTKKFIPNAVKILVKPEKVTVEGIKQYYLGIESETWKLETLFDLYERLQISQTIIFVNSINKAEFIKDKLEEENFIVDCIHSGMSQMERDKIMTSFRTGESRVLVATDVIARGIDVQQVSIVINYDMPKYCETYVHRIGRSGRYGRKGIAINFVVDDDKLQLDRIKRYYRTNIEPLPENIKDMI